MQLEHAQMGELWPPAVPGTKVSTPAPFELKDQDITGAWSVVQEDLVLTSLHHMWPSSKVLQ